MREAATIRKIENNNKNRTFLTMTISFFVPERVSPDASAVQALQ